MKTVWQLSAKNRSRVSCLANAFIPKEAAAIANRFAASPFYSGIANAQHVGQPGLRADFAALAKLQAWPGCPFVLPCPQSY